MLQNWFSVEHMPDQQQLFSCQSTEQMRACWHPQWTAALLYEIAHSYLLSDVLKKRVASTNNASMLKSFVSFLKVSAQIYESTVAV